jgi:hypothetical protein
MNLRLAFLALLTIVLFSCEKDDESEDCTSTQPSDGGENGSGNGVGAETFEYVTSVGSYWVYEWYQVFYDGTEVLTDRVDSVYISGDTLINGENFIIRKGTWFPTSTVRTTYERDSLGYIIGPGNKVRWSYNDFSNPLYTGDYEPVWGFYVFMSDQQVAITPAGPFIAVERQQRLFLSSGEPANSCGYQEINLSTYYVSAVGRVLEQTGYSGPMQQCDYYHEARLIRYYIAP